MKKKEQRERYAQMVFWISTESEMPETDERVLVYDNYKKRTTIARYVGCKIKEENFEWLDDTGAFLSNKDITYWMPLPISPEDKSFI